MRHPDRATTPTPLAARAHLAPPPPRTPQFYTFTYDVVNAKKQGYDLNSLKLEEVFKGGGEERTPMESAVLSQAMRIVFLAIVASEK